LTKKAGKNAIVYAYLVVLISFAAFGLMKNPEEKLMDKDTDNYELYYVCQVIRNTTHPGDKMLLTLKRIQEPQVRFYLRRESVFIRIMNWAKAYIETNTYSHYLVEDKSPYRPLIKYLLQRYRCHKYDRYFLFYLREPGKHLRIFKREKMETNFFFKYFVSEHHQPGKYKEIKDRKSIERVYFRFEKIEDLYPSS
jgi:hypothetical protein